MPPSDGERPQRLGVLVVGSLVDLSVPRHVPADPDVDVVVATGDMTDSATGTIRHLREVFPRPVPIVLVLGPGEFRDGDREATIGRARRSAAARGVTLLDDEEAVVRGVRFVGGTLWTDFRLHGSDEATVTAALEAARPTFGELGIRRGGVPLMPVGSTGLHWRCRSWLGLALPGDLPTVVVTHHAPTGSGMPSSPFLDPLAASRASRCEDLVRQSGALLWAHGGREAVDRLVGATRVVSRPVHQGRPTLLSIDTDAGGGPHGRARPRADPSLAGDVVVNAAQGDLFGVVGTVVPRRRAARAVVPTTPRGVTPAHDAERAASLLDAHADYRVLRRVRPRPVDPVHRLGPGERVALLVDVETTGLDYREHEVIEIGMVAFVHDAAGRVGPVVGTLGMLREPKGEVSPEITRLTGITPRMVAGQAIDPAAVRALLDRADLVIAHNAKFDRAFCERLNDAFRHKPWACSVAEVPWRDLGFEGARLGHLVNGCGLFHDGHRAVDDCHALLEVLAHEVDGATALSHLLRSSASTRVRVWAERAPFEMKDVLKARGYRWNGGGDGRPKAWWTEVDEGNLATELGFLEQEVHLRAAALRRDVLTAHDRHRSG